MGKDTNRYWAITMGKGTNRYFPLHLNNDWFHYQSLILHSLKNICLAYFNIVY